MNVVVLTGGADSEQFKWKEKSTTKIVLVSLFLVIVLMLTIRWILGECKTLLVKDDFRSKNKYIGEQ